MLIANLITWSILLSVALYKENEIATYVFMFPVLINMLALMVRRYIRDES